MLPDNLCIHNASCEMHTPCVFPSQAWHHLIFPGAVSTGHSINNAYVIGKFLMQVYEKSYITCI